MTCDHRGGAVKVIACIEDPIVIKKILEHLDRRAEPAIPAFRLFVRAPPQEEVFGPGGTRLTTGPSLRCGLTLGMVSLAPAGLNGRYLLAENTRWVRGPRNSGLNGRRPSRSVQFAPSCFNAHDARFWRIGWLSFLNSGQINVVQHFGEIISLASSQSVADPPTKFRLQLLGHASREAGRPRWF